MVFVCLSFGLLLIWCCFCLLCLMLRALCAVCAICGFGAVPNSDFASLCVFGLVTLVVCGLGVVDFMFVFVV